ncbi:MAG: SDR family oxidoreductase [Desulfobacteraceae bacterium]|nr:MAG: SDR family oxidoreductase [Desulfobacteraceae bacterium]
MIRFDTNYWALIIGGSSGFGLATARKLARHGMNICIVHRDRRGAMQRIEPLFERIRSAGVQLVAMNTDALSTEGRKSVLDVMKERLGTDGKIRMMLHSVAFGNLKLLAPFDDSEGTYNNQHFLDKEDFSRTIQAMGSNIVEWVQDIHRLGLFAHDARVLSLTSEGNKIAWKGYAAVSAAKAVLESVSRAIAVEFSPYGIRSNVIQAGVCDTPALQVIPGNQKIRSHAMERNPFRRLTVPEDVADVIFLLCLDEASWVNGSLICVDGGESIG